MPNNVPNLIHGQDPGGALRPIQVDDNGNLSIDLVSGVSVSTSITGTIDVAQVSGHSWSTAISTNNSLLVDQVSGSSWSTVVNSFGSSIDTKQVSGSADSVSIIDSSLLVNQVSGSSWSTEVNNSVNVHQVSGSAWSTEVTNSSIPVIQVSGSADSVSVIDSSLLVNQVSGSNFSTEVTNSSLLVNQVSGSAWSAVVAGDVASDSPDSGGGGPVKVGGMARTTNPTAVADADRVNAVFDDLGRQVITPYQVRDLVKTAYVTTTTGIETTLLAGVAGAYLDCLQVVCANTSDAAVDIDFRSVTAGNVEFSVTVPADATAGFVPSIPWLQGNTGNNWTMDVAGSDISTTTVNVSALFVQNV